MSSPEASGPRGSTRSDGGDAGAADAADLAATDPALLRARSRVYDLLSAALDGDVETLLDAIEDGAFARLSAAFPVDLDPEPLVESGHDVEALSVGYDNLFVVPGPHFVPPFASGHAADPSEQFESDSPYHDEGSAGELLGEPASAFARRYERAGFVPDRGEGIPDHVAAAFEFLAALSAAEADHREAGEREAADALHDLQQETLSSLGWLDGFHEAVEQRDAAEGVFAALVAVARAFAAWDARVGVPRGDGSEGGRESGDGGEDEGERESEGEGGDERESG